MTLADRLVVLHQGEALQVGRPLDVYEQPCNRFVAGFLGWPPMNFLKGRLQADGGWFLEAKGARIGLKGAPPPVCEIGQELTLGVRAENVRLADPGEEALARPLTLIMEVDEVERLGGHSLVTLRRGEWRLTAWREGECSLAEQQTAAVKLDATRLHWFDPTSGTAFRSTCSAGERTR
jgi:multiple sugar transport system ATP-binding protein